MLGCHEFCGYYDWTFQHVRQRHGQEAVRRLWRDAIGAEAQRHYLEAGLREGLRGLEKVWNQTGLEEKCDWTFTLDEQRRVLRWDMRQCPSKGFLVSHDLAADEDYCDHCAGWIGPVLARLGLALEHEHNHCGQCWGEIHPIEGPWESLTVPVDIRKDPRWRHGFFDRWRGSSKLPLLDTAGNETDPCEVLTRWFAGVESLLVLGRGPSAVDEAVRPEEYDAVVVTDPTYASRDVFAGEPRAVLIGDRSQVLPEVAQRFHATPPPRRPLLMYTYLPVLLREEPLDFAAVDLPRPVPILPLLIRGGLYTHEPGGQYPTTGVFLALLAAALGKRFTVAGIDLYRHPTGRHYLNAQTPPPGWMPQHSEACDLAHLRRAAEHAGPRMRLTGVAGDLVVAGA